MPPILRFSARVVPVHGDEVLLLLDQDPGRPGELRWGTIGGAIDEGETPVEAALRELFEETGLTAHRSDLSAPFHQDRHEFSWDGTRYLGDSTFFALPLDREAPISFEHLEPAEVGNVVEARWWRPDDSDLDGHLVTPDLARVLQLAVATVQSQRKVDL